VIGIVSPDYRDNAQISVHFSEGAVLLLIKRGKIFRGKL